MVIVGNGGNNRLALGLCLGEVKEFLQQVVWDIERSFYFFHGILKR